MIYPNTENTKVLYDFESGLDHSLNGKNINNPLLSNFQYNNGFYCDEKFIPFNSLETMIYNNQPFTITIAFNMKGFTATNYSYILVLKTNLAWGVAIFFTDQTSANFKSINLIGASTEFLCFGNKTFVTPKKLINKNNIYTISFNGTDSLVLSNFKQYFNHNKIVNEYDAGMYSNPPNINTISKNVPAKDFQGMIYFLSIESNNQKSDQEIFTLHKHLHEKYIS